MLVPKYGLAAYRVLNIFLSENIVGRDPVGVVAEAQM